jgi:hypothetical protein
LFHFPVQGFLLGGFGGNFFNFFVLRAMKLAAVLF